ncbi:unnamed protein product, partial [Symbiodinium sp. KB8]
ETHLGLDQVQQAKSALLTAGLHSFWAGATPENRTKGGLVVATPWQTHPRLVHSFTIEGCGFLAVELPRVRWRLVVISVYLQSGIGLSAEPNATILAHLLALVQTLPNWVAAGDWNVDLDKFASTNIATEAKGQLLGSKEAAISTGNTLDFVLASRSVAGLLRLRVEKIVPFAPHFCLKLEVDVGQGLLNLPALKGFSSIQSLLNSEKGGPAPARFPATSFEETGDSPLPVRTTPDSDQGGTETQQPPRKLVLNIGGVSLAPTAATCGFAAFSCSVELELLGKAYGRGAHNPVEYKPVLRDDRQATRWHARPNAILAQIMRIAKLLEAQQPPPTELLELARQYLAEEEALETSTPAWAEVLGISCDLLPAALPILSQRQVTSLVDGLQQEINLSKLRVSRRSRDSYSRWLQGSSEGGLKLVEHAQGVDFPPLLLWGAIGAYRGPRLLTADGLVAPPAYASRGVLAGCPIAVALSKVALWPACHAVLNQPAVSTADTWVDDLSVDFCGPNPQQVAAKGLRVARSLFGALAEEGLEVSLKKTTWIASSPAVEAALKKQSQGEATQVSSVAKDLGVANAAGRARRTQVQSIRLRKGFTRGTRLQTLRVNSVAHRVRVSKMGSLSAAIWGHQGLGISPKQLRGLRSQAALAGRKQQLGSLDVVFSLGEGNCSDPLRTVILQHWRTLHKLLFAHPTPEQYQRLWKITWTKLASAPKRWALVKGPVAAMVAYLQDLGVDASDPASWRFPPGSLQGTGLWNFEKDTVSVAPGLSSAHRVEEALCRVLQYRANLRISQQDAGAGAQCGIDWSVPRKLLRKQAKRTNQLTALRMVWQGAFFTTVKGAKRQCPLCKKHADLRHVLLECQWWRGKGPSPPPHWHKLQQKWPAASLWLRGLPPASYVAFPALTPDLLLPRLSGIWQAGTSVKAEGLVFGTDATGTTNDQRQIEVTADCRPAILQAGSSTFRAAHANVWEDVWEDRHRLQITWHPSHRTPKEYAERYGSPYHWRVKLNDIADQACKEAAEAVPWRQHAGSVAQLDELVEEVNHFLANRAWTLLAGPVAPPLDVKLETLLGTAHLHGHCFAWPVTDLGKFGLHQSHSFYNMGAVLLCTKCFAAPVQAAQWTPEEMEPGVLSSTSSEVMEDAPLVESISLGEVASALQLASEEAPDAAEAPANPASPGSDTLPGSAPSPSSPAHSVSAQADQALPRESAKAEVVDSTPPDKAAAADPGASGSVQPNPGPETLEVECREGLRTQWLSFVYRPEECAAATLGRCRDQAAMSSLDTLCVWPDKGELDLGLSLSDSLRPGERRLLATAPAQGSASSVASRPRKPVTSEDGLFCFACKQRAPSVEHMSSHFMTSAHVQAVRAYMAQ